MSERSENNNGWADNTPHAPRERHTRPERERGPRIYQCPLCGRPVSRKSAGRSHERHSGALDTLVRRDLALFDGLYRDSRGYEESTLIAALRRRQGSIVSECPGEPSGSEASEGDG